MTIEAMIRRLQNAGYKVVKRGDRAHQMPQVRGAVPHGAGCAGALREAANWRKVK